jgi:lysophospholipase L1-like esterase
MTDKGNARVSLGAYIANLKEIIARSRTFGAQRIILNNNHPTSRSGEIMPFTDISYEQSNNQYNEAVRQMSKSLGSDVTFLDIERHFHDLIRKGAELKTLLLDDGLHLSEKGHDHYLEFVGPTIIQAVRDLAAEA